MLMPMPLLPPAITKYWFHAQAAPIARAATFSLRLFIFIYSHALANYILSHTAISQVAASGRTLCAHEIILRGDAII